MGVATALFPNDFEEDLLVSLYESTGMVACECGGCGWAKGWSAEFNFGGSSYLVA